MASLLHNGLGIKQGKKTTAVAFPLEVIKMIHSVEDMYQEERKRDQNGLPVHVETYEHHGQNHRLYQITNADLTVLLTLHKVCNTNGLITNVTSEYRHHIFQEHLKLFEKPISAAKFYQAFKKLEILGFVQIEERSSGLKTLQVYGVLSDQLDSKGRFKANYYVPIHPVVFTQRFSNLSVAARKLFLEACVHQNMTVKSNFHKDSIRPYTFLFRFLHKTEVHHLKEVAKELMETKDGEAPLFNKFVFSKTEKKAFYSVNSTYKPAKEDEGAYRSPLEQPDLYPRKAKFIRKVLEAEGIGELANDIKILVNMLKHQGYRVIRYVIKELKQFFKRNNTFPKGEALAKDIKKHLRFKRSAEILDLADTYGIRRYVAYNLNEQDREQREFDFTNAFSIYNLKQIRKMFKEASKAIKQQFTQSFVNPGAEYYKSNHSLADVAPHIYMARNFARTRKVDPDTYNREEYRLLEQVNSSKDLNVELDRTIEILLTKVEKMPVVDTIPAVTVDLEEYILKV